MSTNVQNLIQSALGDGARSTKFDVMFQFTNPNLFPNQRNVAVLVKSSNFPSKSCSTINIPYKGRSIPIRGQEKFSQSWECTFYLDENHKIKNAFEAWIDALDETVHYAEAENSLVTSTRSKHVSTNNYTTEICLFQQNFNDTDQTAKYILHNVFPTEVGSVQLSSEGPGNLLEFTVTFSFSYFDLEVMKGSQGNFISSAMENLKNSIASAGQEIIGAINNEISNQVNAFVKASGVEELMGQGSNFVSSMVDDVSSDIKDLINGTDTSYAEKFGDMFSGLTGGLGGLKDSLASKASSLVSSAKDKVSGMFS